MNLFLANGIIRSVFFFHLVLLMASCGYRWQTAEGMEGGLPTISVPYVDGDSDGALTGELIRALAVSGVGDIRSFGARYRLQVAVLSANNQTIGYRRDRQQIDGKSKKNLVSSEARRSLVVEATLYEEISGRIVCGPFRVDADVDYDYVDGDSVQDLTFLGSDGVSRVVLPFSLGQLESVEAAQEAAARPLYVRLAKKIVDVMFIL
jgi:hypothetical protein